MPDICEQIISQLPALRREAFRKRYQQGIQAGNLRCVDCGLMVGVFRVTLHNVIGKDNREKKVCQICVKEYKK